MGQIRKAKKIGKAEIVKDESLTMTDIVQNIVVILSDTANKPRSMKLPDIVTGFIAKMYPTDGATDGGDTDRNSETNNDTVRRLTTVITRLKDITVSEEKIDDGDKTTPGNETAQQTQAQQTQAQQKQAAQKEIESIISNAAEVESDKATVVTVSAEVKTKYNQALAEKTEILEKYELDMRKLINVKEIVKRESESENAAFPSSKDISFALVLAFMTVASDDNRLELSKKFSSLRQIIDMSFLKILFDRGSIVGKIVTKAYDEFTAPEMSFYQWAGLLAECYELFFDDDEQKRGGATTSPPNMQGGSLLSKLTIPNLSDLMPEDPKLAGLAGIVLIIVILWIFYKSDAASWVSKNNPMTGGNSTWSKYSPVENFKQRKGKVFANNIDFKDVQKDAEEHGILFIYEKKN
jgi:hypothetical protein